MRNDGRDDDDDGEEARKPKQYFVIEMNINDGQFTK